ncbi:MAG: hypothetical protein VKJ64_01455 [Leptolyngbyaceae bacterium]|nr:hypothetical protein [Leptolyngbyaceae bacterium]
MFGKKRSPSSESNPPRQSQSIGGSVTGSTVQMGQAGGDSQQNQVAENQSAQQGLTGAEVVALLSQLESAVKASPLTPEQQESIRRVGTAHLTAHNSRFVGWALPTLRPTTNQCR